MSGEPPYPTVEQYVVEAQQPDGDWLPATVLRRSLRRTREVRERLRLRIDGRLRIVKKVEAYEIMEEDPRE